MEDAVSEAGMVYHAVGDDGSEVWIDTENEMFRRVDETDAGRLTSVGTGWTEISYDPLQNVVLEEDQNPTGPQRPRIDRPMVVWSEPLGALAFAQEFNVIGETSADGRLVFAVEARTPITSDGEPTGRVLVGRVDLDPETWLPLAYERREDVPPEATPSQARTRTVYTTSELIPRSDLPEDWFDAAVVEEQKLTIEENIALMRDIGITPYWLGENFESENGLLSLPPARAVIPDPGNQEGELRYALIVPTSETSAEPLLEAVVVRLGLNADGFGPPTIPEIGGALPEDSRDVVVRGQTVPLYTSLLSPADLGCGQAECPETSAQLYRRVVFSIGDTTVQVEAFARINAAGKDLNGYNSVDALVALAEALMEVEATE
ncbi:MAG TPA: hypothetical protein VMR52_12280 [Dehalococcoidia bacterium]|nr:hypothetical protein [Dehalococcoidia bacterium]